MITEGYALGEHKTFNIPLASTAELVEGMKHFISALKTFITVDSFYSINKNINYHHEVKIDDSSIKKGSRNIVHF